MRRTSPIAVHNSVRFAPKAPSAKRRSLFRPRIECLEDRRVLAAGMLSHMTDALLGPEQHSLQALEQRLQFRCVCHIYDEDHAASVRL